MHIYIQALNHSTALFTIKTTYDGSFISFYSILRFLFRNNTFSNETIVNVSSDCCAVFHILRLHQFISNVKDCFHSFIGMCAIVIVFPCSFFSLLDIHFCCLMYYNIHIKNVQNTSCTCMVKSRQK